MQKRALILNMKMIIAICVLLSCCGCAGTYFPTTMLEDFFTKTVSKEQASRQADPNNLSQDMISLLEDRIFIQMPEGAVHPTKYQQQLLHVPELDHIRNKDEVIWAGSNEVLKIVAIESLCFVDEDWDATNTTMVFKPDQDKMYLLQRDYYQLLTVHVRMTDNTMVDLRFSLYTLGGKERIDHFYNVAKAITNTITPARALDLDAHTVEWEDITFETPAGFYVDIIKGTTQMYKDEDVDNAAVIYKLTNTDKRSFIQLEIAKDINVEKFSSGSISKSDRLLEKTFDWKFFSDQIGVRMFGVVPLNSGENLRISIIADNEKVAQELFNIIHTLKKK